MPIKIPSGLPALEGLSSENIFAMDTERAMKQNIRPLNVGILNLMPNKIETELQILRLLSNTPLQINVDLIRIDETAPKNTPESHMTAFYHSFSKVKDKKYDGLIITGAPLGNIAYNEVKYWDKMKELMDWSRINVQSTIFLCWAAHAAMYHYYGVDRVVRKTKLSGVFEHTVLDAKNELMRGFDPHFWAPHSRIGEIPLAQYEAIEGLSVLAHSAEAGVYMAATDDKRLVYVTGHPEYDPETLAQEYQRDVKAGMTPEVPKHYFEQNEPSGNIQVRWKSHGNLFFTNWLNYCVYQTTPFDLNELG